MSFAPVSLIMPQYSIYALWYLKAYEQGTTTPLSMATDATGATTLAKAQIDSEGFPLSAVGTRFIPYIDGDYDLWVIPTEKQANKNILVDAFQLADNLNTGLAAGDLLPPTDGVDSIGDATNSWLNITMAGDVYDQNGNELLEFSETASAVNHVQVQNSITGTGPTISPAGDDANIDLNLAAQGTGLLKYNALEVMNKNDVISNHVRAGNKQIIDGSSASGSSFDIITEVASSAVWETVGPTGSGADTEWAILDNLPSNATILKCFLEMSFTSTGTGQAGIGYYATGGDVVTPTTGLHSVLGLNFANVSTAGKVSFDSFPVEIPLNSSHIFKILWTNAVTSARSGELHYRGFDLD